MTTAGGVTEEAAVVITGEVGLLAGRVDEPEAAVEGIDVVGPVLEAATPAPVVPVAVVATDVPAVGPDVPAVGAVEEEVGTDDAEVGWPGVGDGVGVPLALVDPLAGGGVPLELVDPPAAGGVPLVLVDPTTGGGVPLALVDPPAGVVVRPASVDPPAGGVVPLVLVDPPTRGGVPLAAVDPPAGVVVPPARVDPPAGVVVPVALVGPDAVVFIAVPVVGLAVVSDASCVDAVGVVEAAVGIKPVSGAISFAKLISNSIFPFFNVAVP